MAASSCAAAACAPGTSAAATAAAASQSRSAVTAGAGSSTGALDGVSPSPVTITWRSCGSGPAAAAIARHCSALPRIRIEASLSARM
jgi:hypothetical protein